MEEQLIALWHGMESANTIAPRLGITPNQLTHMWRRLRQQHKLPSHRRNDAGCSNESDINDHLDGRPGVGRDRLLKKLFAVHREPRFDLFNEGETRG